MEVEGRNPKSFMYIERRREREEGREKRGERNNEAVGEARALRGLEHPLTGVVEDGGMPKII
jgi:hypothetical protein